MKKAGWRQEAERDEDWDFRQGRLQEQESALEEKLFGGKFVSASRGMYRQPAYNSSRPRAANSNGEHFHFAVAHCKKPGRAGSQVDKPGRVYFYPERGEAKTLCAEVGGTYERASRRYWVPADRAALVAHRAGSTRRQGATRTRAEQHAAGRRKNCRKAGAAARFQGYIQRASKEAVDREVELLADESGPIDFGNIADNPRACMRYWRLAEDAERREDGRVQEQLFIELPHEFRPAECREVLAKLALVFERIGLRYHCVAHKPDVARGGDRRNQHAHLIYSERRAQAAEGGGWDFEPKKVREVQHWTFLPQLRSLWADLCNEVFARIEQDPARENPDRRYDPRSFRERGIPKQPTEHLGARAMGLERAGVATRTGVRNAVCEGLWREQGRFAVRILEEAERGLARTEDCLQLGSLATTEPQRRRARILLDLCDDATRSGQAAGNAELTARMWEEEATLVPRRAEQRHRWALAERGLILGTGAPKAPATDRSPRVDRLAAIAREAAAAFRELQEEAAPLREQAMALRDEATGLQRAASIAEQAVLEDRRALSVELALVAPLVARVDAATSVGSLLDQYPERRVVDAGKGLVAQRRERIARLRTDPPAAEAIGPAMQLGAAAGSAGDPLDRAWRRRLEELAAEPAAASGAREIERRRHLLMVAAAAERQAWEAALQAERQALLLVAPFVASPAEAVCRVRQLALQEALPLAGDAGLLTRLGPPRPLPATPRRHDPDAEIAARAALAQLAGSWSALALARLESDLRLQVDAVVQADAAPVLEARRAGLQAAARLAAAQLQKETNEGTSGVSPAIASLARTVLRVRPEAPARPVDRSR